MSEAGAGKARDTEAEREAFASAVEDYFLRRRGSAILVSPKDWVLVSGWFDEGIPLPVVLAGLAEVFDRQVASGRTDPVSSISYCRHAVKKRWAEWQLSQSGSAETAKRRKKKDPANDPAVPLAGRFRETAERLREEAPVVAAALEAILPRLEALEADEETPLSDREGVLIDLERDLVRELLPKLPAEDREAVEAEMEGRLGRLRELPPPEELERLREIGRLRAVRHRWALPRFTLLPRG